MAQQSGALSRLLLSYETAYGANPSPTAAKVVPIISHTLGRKRGVVQPDVIDGYRGASKPVYGLQDISGDITVPVELGNLGYWLRAAFGQTSSPYGDASATAQPSLVLEDQASSPAKYFRYNGMMVRSLGFDFGPGANYQCRVGVVGKVMAPAGTSYDAAPTAAITKVPIAYNHLALSIAGAPVTYFTRFSLDVDLGIVTETHAISGGGKETQVLAGRIGCSGNLEALLSATDLATWESGETEVEIELVATVAVSQTLTITMPTCLIHTAENPLPGPGGRMISGQYTAYDNTRDGVLGRQVQFALANGS